MIENTTVDGSQINQLRPDQDLNTTARIYEDTRNFSEKLDIQSSQSTNSRPGSLDDIREEEKVKNEMEVIKEDEMDSNVSNSMATSSKSVVPDLKRLDTLILDIAEDANSEAE